MKVYSRGLFFRDTLLATVFIFLSIFLFAQLAIHLGALDPIHKALADFDYTDLAYKIPHESADEALAAKQIVIVELGKDRLSIAEQLNTINRYNPKVVALDAWFTSPKDSAVDELLLQACNDIPKLVTGSYLQAGENTNDHNNHDETSYSLVSSFGQLGKTGQLAFVNFGGEYEKTIRFFLPEKNVGGQSVPSFAAAIMQNYDKGKYQELLSRHNEVEYINYTFSTDDFFKNNPNTPELISVIDLTSLSSEELREKIQGKIVLIGEVNSMSMEDSHFTPFNKRLSGRSKPDMPGVLIHANVIKMILQSNYVHKVPTWLIWTLSVIITYLVVLFFTYHFVENHIWYHLYAKIFQLVIAFVVIYIELVMLAKLNIKFNEMAILAPMFISVDLLYFYDAIVKFFHQRFGFNTYFMKHHH